MSCLVANPEERFSGDEAQVVCVPFPHGVWGRIVNSVEPRHEKTLFSGFVTRVDSNRPAQLQKQARGLKCRIYELDVLNYPGSERKRR